MFKNQIIIIRTYHLQCSFVNRRLHVTFFLEMISYGKVNAALIASGNFLLYK